MVEWDKILIKTDSGQEVMGIAPMVISASRSTDIPGCYSDWFMHRLLGPGYVSWENPFNRAVTRVSLQKAKAIVFWTKNAAPMMKHLRWLDDAGIAYYFQHSLNDYEMEGYEPRIPHLAARIATFKELSRAIGKHRVVWRFDPIILSSSVTPQVILQKIKGVGEELKDHTERLVFSYVDIAAYTKVRSNLKGSGQECSNLEMRAIAEGIVDLNKSWGLELSTCSETIELADLGVSHSNCVDGELLKRIAPGDEALLRFIEKNGKKDTGQRKECGCIPSKDIGQYDTCTHMCQYCYANRNQKAVEANWARHLANSRSEFINGVVRDQEHIASKQMILEF